MNCALESDDGGTDLCDLGQARCGHATEKAICVTQGRGLKQRTFWVPKAVLHDDSEVYKPSTSGRLVVLAWWAEREGLT